jgi:hypothetical protein
MQSSDGRASGLGTFEREVTAGHKTNNKSSKRKQNSWQVKHKKQVSDDALNKTQFIHQFPPIEYAHELAYRSLKSLEATHSKLLGYQSTLDYFKTGRVSKALRILENEPDKYQPFQVNHMGLTYYLYVPAYDNKEDKYIETFVTDQRHHKLSWNNNNTTDTSSTSESTVIDFNQVFQDNNTLYTTVPPGFEESKEEKIETKDTIIDFSGSGTETPVQFNQSNNKHEHKPVTFTPKNKSYEKNFKPNFKKIADQYNNNNDTIIDFQTKDEAKALKILKDNDALAQEPPVKPPSIDNTPLTPFSFEYEPLNGTVYRKRTLFDASLRSIQIAAIILFYIIMFTFDYLYIDNHIFLGPLYIIIGFIFSHFVVHLTYLHYPVLATPGWYYDYAEAFVPQSLTHVRVEYIRPSPVPQSGDVATDSRPVMTRAGKIDHGDPQIWDVILTESYLLQDTSLKGRMRQAILGRIRYFTRLKIMNIKISLELLANIMALKTLNRDDPIDVLRVKIKQSMGNINCINIPRYFAIQNEFIQSNTLDIALHQLRSLREGQDFQLAL